MSTKVDVSLDKNGFLKCQECPRRFLTKTGFENHSSNQHEDNETNGAQLSACAKYAYDIIVSLSTIELI